MTLPILLGDFSQYLFGLALFFTSTFMILLVLVQRGRGGGLAGALGGPGGQSAFGTKAGDLFTRITAWTAVVWFGLCIATILVNRSSGEKLDDIKGGSSKKSATAEMRGIGDDSDKLTLPPTQPSGTPEKSLPAEQPPAEQPPAGASDGGDSGSGTAPADGSSTDGSGTDSSGTDGADGDK